MSTGTIQASRTTRGRRGSRHAALSALLALMLALTMLPWAPSQASAKAGDTFTVANADGVDITYKVLYESSAVSTVQVGTGERFTPAIDAGLAGALVIPESVTYNGRAYIVTGIGDYGLYYASSLTSITLPSSLENIGSNAFQGCEGVTSLALPDGVASVGEWAFGSMGLTSFTVPGSLADISAYMLNGNRSLASVTIPSTVKTIGGSAFGYCTKLTYLTVPDSVTSIGEGAFNGCESLRSVTLPSSLTSIEKFTFQYCGSLKSLTIPSTVGSIGSSAFTRCTSLKSIAIPASVGSIGDQAFSECSSLAALVFLGNAAPELLSHYAAIDPDVPPKTFIGLPATGTLYYPEGAQGYTDGRFAAAGLPSGWQLAVGEPEPEPRLEAGDTFAAESAEGVDVTYRVLTVDSAFGPGTVEVYLDQLTWATAIDDGYTGALTIPATVEHGVATYAVTGIGDCAFVQCALSSVDIPSTVESIGDGAFEYCLSLASITIPDGVTSIGLEAFCGCSSLASITIPASVGSIGDQAFYNCSTLAALTFLGDSAPSLATMVLTGLPATGTLYYPEGAEASYTDGRFAAAGLPSGWELVAVGEPGLAAGDTFTAASAEGVDVTYRVLTVGSDSSPGTVEVYLDQLTWATAIDADYTGALTIPATVEHGGVAYAVTGIGDGAFLQCALSSVDIPSTVESIGDYAFEYCWFLASVAIPDGVTSIGPEAFCGCTSLASLTIPASVGSIGSQAFYNCSSLSTLTFLGVTAPSVGAISLTYLPATGTLYYPEGAEASYTDGRFATAGLPSGWELIAVGEPGLAAGDIFTAVSAEGIEVTYKVLSVGSGSVPGTVQAGAGGTNDRAVGTDATGQLTVPTTVEYGGASYAVTGIGAYAFRGCSLLSSVTVPDGVTGIGAYAFYGCSSLASIAIPDGVTGIAERMFQGCSSLASVTIPDGVESIGDYAFYGCSSLASLAIPDGVTGIGNQAFRNCTSLASITIPDSVTGIAERMFQGCSSLVSVTIPEGVTSIGSQAFWNCSSLASIAIPDGVESIGSQAFQGCAALASLTIPASVGSIGSQAFYSCSSLTALTFLGDSAPSVGGDAFKGLPATGTLYYPEGAEASYTDGRFATAGLPSGWQLVAVPAGPEAITGTTTIEAGGTYALDAALAGATITIATTEPVTLVGRGIGGGVLSGPDSLANSRVSIVCSVAGVDLTLEDVFINGPVDSGSNVLHFTGAGNSLTLAGTNGLETTQAPALVHVPSGVELGIVGTGTAYLYKSANGAGIGGSAEEANGTITIDGPTLFAKGTKMGALIGSGGYASGTPGAITIAGGELNLIGNARGAVIGTGASATSLPGDIFITGGTININVDFSGSAIGNGNNSPVGGRAYITGGSVRTFVDTNAVGSWGASGVTAAGVSPAVITAATLDAQGEPTYLLALDTAALAPPPVAMSSQTGAADGGTAGGDTAPAAAPFTVLVDGSPYYAGDLHRYLFVQEDKDKDLGEQVTITTTPSNWILNPSPDTRLYLYLTGEDHELTVNGEPFDAAWDEDTQTFTVAAPVPEPKTGQPGSGDFDGDGSVTASDALVAATSVIGSAVLTDAQKAAVDIDGDGALTMADVVLIMRKAMGL